MRTNGRWPKGKAMGWGGSPKTSTHWKAYFQTLEAMFPTIGSNPSTHQKQNIIRWASKYHPLGIKVSSDGSQSIIR